MEGGGLFPGLGGRMIPGLGGWMISGVGDRLLPGLGAGWGAVVVGVRIRVVHWGLLLWRHIIAQLCITDTCDIGHTFPHERCPAFSTR